MTFVTYSPMDAIGTAAGLTLLEKINSGLLHGSFLGVSILAIFTFLSLAKIALDTIIEHKYITAILEFLRLTIVLLLFTVTTTATIFNMSIINFGYANQAAQNGSTFIGTHLGGWLFGGNNFNPTSAESQITNVPLMADIYAIPDNLAYQFANVMLNPSKSMTIDLTSMILDPRSILDAGLASLINSSTDKGSLYNVFAKCYDQQAYEVFKNIGEANMSCDQFNQKWAESAQNIENQIKQQADVDPRVLKDMDYMIYLLKQGTFQNDSNFKNKYLGTELERLNDAANVAKKWPELKELTSIRAAGNENSAQWYQKLGNNLAALTQIFFSKTGQVFSQAVTPKQFLEELMLHMQEYAIAIMFLLLPFVVIIGLLPIFGSNYKLIIRYTTSFFLIKLWIPILWFVYVSMADASALLISSAVIIQHGIHFIGSGICLLYTSPSPRD